MSEPIYTREFWQRAEALLNTHPRECGKCRRNNGAEVWSRPRNVKTRSGQMVSLGHRKCRLRVRLVLLDRNQQCVTPGNLGLRCNECFPETEREEGIKSPQEPKPEAASAKR